MCAHYVITPEFCTPRSGWEKGRVERQIGTLRNVLFKPRPDVETLDCLNGQLAQRCLSHAREHPHPDFPEISRSLPARSGAAWCRGWHPSGAMRHI